MAGSQITRNLPNGPYQGATNNVTNPPSAVNPFATIADLGALADGNGIYDGGDSLSIDTTVNQLAFNMSFVGTGTFAIGTAAVSGVRLTVGGTGNTSATTLANFESNNGTNRLVIKDDGRLLTGSGVGATDFGFGQTHRVSGYTTGFAYYSESGVVTNTSIQHRGSTANAIGLNVAFQNNPTGVVKAILGNVPSGAGTEHIGVQGQSRDASQYSVGVYGLIIGGGGTTPSVYSSAVRGLNESGVDSLSFAGRFASQYNNIAVTYTKNMVGVYGSAETQNGNVLSTSTGIGGQFLTAGVNGSGLNMAINVPNTGNNGNVVINRDASSINKRILEMSGEIELFEDGDGMWFRSPNGTIYHLTITDAGAWLIV